ncbi:MAG: zinc ribbon domain-containing protein [Gemmatimonadetes bacterium]|nr:zinc ribbon domain-containing protein [Gemmatimonadota bacterium]
MAALEADEKARSGTLAGGAAAVLEAEIAEARASLRSGALCPDCGYGNEPGSRFCSSCGHALHGVPAA